MSRSVISPAGLGSPLTYELCSDRIVVRFLGLVPLRLIALEDVLCLRLASQDEMPSLLLPLNWIHFLPRRRSLRPVYLLQTFSGKRLFLRLASGAHFRLRRAIAQSKNEPHVHRFAA